MLLKPENYETLKEVAQFSFEECYAGSKYEDDNVGVQANRESIYRWMKHGFRLRMRIV